MPQVISASVVAIKNHVWKQLSFFVAMYYFLPI